MNLSSCLEKNGEEKEVIKPHWFRADRKVSHKRRRGLWRQSKEYKMLGQPQTLVNAW